MKSHCLLSSFSDYDSYWIGLQVKTEFLWEDGTAKSDWLTLENNNKDCVYIEPNNNNQYEFKTKNCNDDRHYLCQMSFQSCESTLITWFSNCNFMSTCLANFINKHVDLYLAYRILPVIPMCWKYMCVFVFYVRIHVSSRIMVRIHHYYEGWIEETTYPCFPFWVNVFSWT